MGLVIGGEQYEYDNNAAAMRELLSLTARLKEGSRRYTL
jgi:hypothetical protein